MNYELESIWLASKQSLYFSVVERIKKKTKDTDDEMQMFASILNEVVKTIHAEAGTLWFYHRFTDGRIWPVAVYGGSSMGNFSMGIGEGIVGKCIETGESEIVEDCSKDPRWSNKSDSKSGFITKTMICVPLKLEELTYASIQIINKTDGMLYDDRDLEFVEELSAEVSKLLHDCKILRPFLAYASMDITERTNKELRIEDIFCASSKEDMEDNLWKSLSFRMLSEEEREDVISRLDEIREIYIKSLG